MPTTIELAEAIQACERCELRKGCRGPVPGAGPHPARLMFIGEAPGAHEWKEPFTGPAGKLLTQLLKYIGLTRDEVYISNVVKCRPAGNRTPELHEANFCAGQWLQQELAIVQPEIIVTVGLTATQYFIPGATTLASVERVAHKLGDWIIFPVMHPAAMLHGEGSSYASKLIGNDFMALERLLEHGVPVDDVITDYVEITDPDDINFYPRVGLDAEWAPDGTLSAVQIATAPGEAYLIRAEPHLLQVLNLALVGSEIVTQNGVGDAEKLAQYGVNITPTHDVMMALYVLQRASQGLKENAREILGMKMQDFQVVFPSKDFTQGVPEDQVYYGCRDADATLRLIGPLLEEVDAEGMRNIYDLGMAQFPIALKAQQYGMLVDQPYLKELTAEFEEKMETARTSCLVGIRPDFEETLRSKIKRFDPHGSNWRQVNDLLFKELRLKPTKRNASKTGWATDATALNIIRPQNPRLIDAILEYRRLHKLVTTYLRPLPGHIKEDGRVHTTIKLMTTETGRWAAEDPDMLNQPVRTEEGRRVSDAYVTAPGYSFVSIDLSQIELRALADVSRDPVLTYAFLTRVDIHRLTAADVLEIPIEEVTPEQRQDAKVLNFGLAYALSAMGFLDALRNADVDMDEKDIEWATGFIADFFARRPGIRRYMRAARAFAEEHLFIKDSHGRRRWCFLMMASFNDGLFEAGARQAINMPIQSDAGFIIQTGMVNAMRLLEDEELDAHLLIQIYDSLLLEVRDEDIEPVARLVKGALINAVQLSVPLEAEVKVGKRWGSLEVYELAS